MRLAFVVLLAGVLARCGGSTPGSAASDAGAAPADDAGSAFESDAADAGSACPAASEPTNAGKIASVLVTEASGIVASRTNPGAYWVHNDSGDGAHVFAVGSDGAALATLTFDTTAPTDIEDIAIEDEPAGGSALYLGDIGDNGKVRASLTIHRVAEPKLDGTAQLTATSEKMTVVYADGPHDAETLLFDPESKDLFIATKSLLGPSDIHRVGAFASGAKVTTQKVATVDVALATGGDISRDGRLVAIRNYGTNAFVWRREPGETVAEALRRPPCTVPVAVETQGEAFGFFVDASGYVTVSEGTSSELHVAKLSPRL